MCGQLPIVIGSGRACDLAEISFADVLDESRQVGYQRRFDVQHSREFRRYIESPGASTIPLTFNLRGAKGQGWDLIASDVDDVFDLVVRLPRGDAPPVMAQVDCQHRLGSMADSQLQFAFQCYLGLNPSEEMAIFNVINGKAKGLNPSLLDYHRTKLTPGIDVVQLDLYIAKTLHDDPASVWHGRLSLGGQGAGTKRKVSLRALQAATKELLRRAMLDSASQLEPLRKYEIVRSFWRAVSATWPTAWAQPRTHLLTKGVGVTALSMLAGQIVMATLARGEFVTEETFLRSLRPLVDLDWSNSGPFKAYGGRQGASEAYRALVQRVFGPALACA